MVSLDVNLTLNYTLDLGSILIQSISRFPQFLVEKSGLPSKLTQ